VNTWLDHPLHCPCVECSARDSRYARRRGTARSLIERLASRGVSFRLVNRKVRFRPSRLVTDGERSEIRRVRDEMCEIIARGDEGGAGGLAALPPVEVGQVRSWTLTFKAFANPSLALRLRRISG
jgi:hypothetical protein